MGMPDRDVQGIADFGFGSQIKAFWGGQAGFDLLQVSEDYCVMPGPQITTFWGLRYATRGRSRDCG